MRPTLRLLAPDLVRQILDEAFRVLAELGVEIHNPAVLALLTEHGATVDAAQNRARAKRELVEQALATVPQSFKLHDVSGKPTHDLSGDNVYFTPGSAALNVLDYETGRMRRPNTLDYVHYAKLVSRLDNIASQSTAFIPADVPGPISDSYRLYLSLLYGEKPVVTGTFTVDSFNLGEFGGIRGTQ